MQMILLVVLAVAAVALIVYSLMPKGDQERDAVKRRLNTRSSSEPDIKDITSQARESATAGLVNKARPMLDRLIMPTSDEEQTQLKAKLANAGIRGPNAQATFLASKSILAVIGLICALGAGLSMALDLPLAIGAACFGAGAGFMAPNLWLSMAIGSRQDKIRRGLPDTLDLMVVSVESGLALDAAIKRVGDEMSSVHHDLAEEMRIATMESQMGIPRGEALEHMAQRAGIEELRGLVSTIVQAEKFGTSVAKALRNQAATLRTKRQQQAEERAQKTAVKLLLPLILFIFPALGIVLAGPAVIGFMKAMGETPGLSGS